MNKVHDSGESPQDQDKKEAIINRMLCATLEGVQAKEIEVEATFTKGLPGFTVVGLASSDIQEAKERVSNQSSLYAIKVHCTKIFSGRFIWN